MPTKIPSLEKLRDKWFTFTEIFEENKLSLTYLLMIVLNQMFYVRTFYIFTLKITKKI